ncbi:pirin family protein [Piscinibacter sakaiensis]|uniref:pirin family protein n=1 Tax=Piscinibacter sakaiensis TaxID=1547922 RepID=UPI003AAB6722
MSGLIRLSPIDKDLGSGFKVRRLLPSAQCPAVGPFVFFDHFGPAVAQPEDDWDVRPHPHIGLATVTYLFEGAMVHRDSTAVVQRIEPGAINLMIAGNGIVHSERTPDDLRAHPRPIHGLQLWLALPQAHEDDEPSFQHVSAEQIPKVQVGGASVRVLIGDAFGVVSPVHTLSQTLYLDIELAAGVSMVMAAQERERALYSVDNGFSVDGIEVAPMTLVVLEPGSSPGLRAPSGARLVMIGGTPLGHRHMWWNFVSTRSERIRRAQDDWAAQRIGQVPGETEFIPLPER